MHLGSFYLVTRDFEKSLAFYEKLLDMPVTNRNRDRFAEMIIDGRHNISFLNPYYDVAHPDMIELKGGQYPEFDTMTTFAEAPNTHKFVINLWTEDLRAEYARIQALGITEHITGIRYLCSSMPYWYFQLKDPDDNIIEVTGGYVA